MKYNDILVAEHEDILVFLDIIRKECYQMYESHTCNPTRILEIVEIVKYYADEYHHGKEEKFLFQMMQEKLGAVGEKMIQHGMLVEHDLGRLYMQTTRAALQDYQDGHHARIVDIIANLTCYCDLLQRHIDKENQVIYTYALRKLDEKDLLEVEEHILTFENDHQDLRESLIKRLKAL